MRSTYSEAATEAARVAALASMSGFTVRVAPHVADGYCIECSPDPEKRGASSRFYRIGSGPDETTQRFRV